jgi:DNA-binding CsgD family transcriptional regulator
MANRRLELMRVDDESDWPDRILHTLGLHAFAPISDQQRRVLAAASVGLTTVQTALALGVAVDTVMQHRKQANLRLGTSNITHAVASALRRGLID